MTIKVGAQVPETKIQTMVDGNIRMTDLASVSVGKKVVVFGLPGAYTPTCSNEHLPGFVSNAENLFGKGVDLVACLSVNDVFVMDAWAKSHEVDQKIQMLADGNAELTRDLGLEFDGSGFGMGVRSKRYVMVIEDKVVKHLAVDEDGGCSLSSADSVMEKL